MVSLLSGIFIILLIGSALGCGIGGMLSRHITIENLNQVYYDTSFSNVADVELEQTPEEGMEGSGMIRIVPICSMGIVILLGAFISAYKVNKILRYEPIDMLGMKLV